MKIVILLTLGYSIFLNNKAAFAGDLHSDSLAAREVFDSLKTGTAPYHLENDGKRITRLKIYYEGLGGAIPAALGKLDGLRKLDLTTAGITAIPKEIENLKLLDTINISATLIGPTLPDEIGNLPNLRFLKVSGSRLASLPNTLMKLSTISYLDFSRNLFCPLNDSLKNWILSISPHALDAQQPKNCTTSSLPRRSQLQPEPGQLKFVSSENRFALVYDHLPSVAKVPIRFYSSQGTALGSTIVFPNISAAPHGVLYLPSLTLLKSEPYYADISWGNQRFIIKNDAH